MGEMKKIIPNVPLSLKAANNLRKRIMEEFPEGGKLESEPELAKQLGVHRATIRQALQILQQEGIVIRRQGSGTFVNRHVINVILRLESIQRFEDLIKNAGYQYERKLLDLSKEVTDSEAAHQLEMLPDATVLISRVLILADKEPAVYIEDSIPTTIIKHPHDQYTGNPGLFHFLKSYCDTQIEYGLSEIISRICGKEISPILDLDPGAAVLQLNTTFYNRENSPIMFSRVYYVDPIMRFHIIRWNTERL
jgi:GntR family transcriptional regulator